MAALAFTGSTGVNLTNGLIGCAISLVVAAAVTYFFGFSKNDPALQREVEKKE